MSPSAWAQVPGSGQLPFLISLLTAGHGYSPACGFVPGVAAGAVVSTAGRSSGKRAVSGHTETVN